MGELTRAQELRVDEFTVRKLRGSHDTIQNLTSQIQELQERVKCMNDSGAFQDIESNYSGDCCHVPSQPAVVPSPRSMLSSDRHMPFDTWNLSETHGNVLGNPRLMFDSAQTLYQGALRSTTPSSTGAIPVQVITGRPVARGEERIGSTTPMPMSAGRPSTMNSFLPAEIPQNSMAVQQRLQISEILPHLQRFQLEDKLQDPSECLCQFSLRGCVMDQRSGDGRFSG